MQPTDRERFLSAITACAETFGKPLSDAQLTLWWKLLGSYTIDDVERGFHAHLLSADRGRFMPVPADIVFQIEIRSSDRPTSDEAWAMVPRDEDTTAVLTRETLRALSVAQPLLNEGDQVAARMAFRDAYAREVRESKDAGRPVQWQISLGHDSYGRPGALLEAVELGRIGAESALNCLSGDQRENFTQALSMSKPASEAIASQIRAALTRAA